MWQSPKRHIGQSAYGSSATKTCNFSFWELPPFLLYTYLVQQMLSHQQSTTLVALPHHKGSNIHISVCIKQGGCGLPYVRNFHTGYGIFHVIHWSIRLYFIESQWNMPYPIWKFLTYGSAQPPYYTYTAWAAWKLMMMIYLPKGHMIRYINIGKCWLTFCLAFYVMFITHVTSHLYIAHSVIKNSSKGKQFFYWFLDDVLFDVHGVLYSKENGYPNMKMSLLNLWD